VSQGDERIDAGGSGYVVVVSGRGKALMAFKPDIDPRNGKSGHRSPAPL